MELRLRTRMSIRISGDYLIRIVFNIFSWFFFWATPVVYSLVLFTCICAVQWIKRDNTKYFVHVYAALLTIDNVFIMCRCNRISSGVSLLPFMLRVGGFFMDSRRYFWRSAHFLDAINIAKVNGDIFSLVECSAWMVGCLAQLRLRFLLLFWLLLDKCGHDALNLCVLCVFDSHHRDCVIR